MGLCVSVPGKEPARRELGRGSQGAGGGTSWGEILYSL
jgi:hypothetical protein